jgi:hypothetical protein
MDPDPSSDGSVAGSISTELCFVVGIAFEAPVAGKAFFLWSISHPDQLQRGFGVLLFGGAPVHHASGLFNLWREALGPPVLGNL